MRESCSTQQLKQLSQQDYEGNQRPCPFQYYEGNELNQVGGIAWYHGARNIKDDIDEAVLI